MHVSADRQHVSTMIKTTSSDQAGSSRSREVASRAIKGRSRLRRYPPFSRVLVDRWISLIVPTIERPVLGITLGTLLCSGVVLLLEFWPGPKGSSAPSAPLVFLLPAVLASTLGGWSAGVCVTVIAIAAWDWFILPPAPSLGIDSVADVVTLVVYLIVATVTVELSTALRHRTKAALQHERELAAVLDVTHAVASTLDMETVLGLVLEQVQSVIDCTSAAVLLQQDDRICIASYRGPNPTEQVIGQSWPLSEATVYPEIVRRQAQIAVPDVDEASTEAELFRGSSKIHVLGGHERSWLWVPLLSKDQVIGVLSLSHRRPHAFSERLAQLVLTIAHQLAIAIENARLYERSRETAAEAERNRLARELHDSVTQMLFSASLIAEVLPRIWERDPETARQSLEELRVLTRGASDEMRALLVELRPGALAEAKLEELLRRLAEAIQARTRVPIHVTVDGGQPIPSNVQVALYRIAQEALTNAAKHAQARRMGIGLRAVPDGIELTIRDDGRGFDQTEVRPGHFGLNTMRERANEISASLNINSSPGHGTEVVARWPI